MGSQPDGRVDSFGGLLRRYRGARGLTQEELAERAGVHAQEISKLERGVRRAPRSTTVEFLADALKLNASERKALEAAAKPKTIPPRPATGIPPDPIPHFVGREAELAEIHLRLRECRSLAIDGLGGIGKTQLVIRYLHGHRAEYGDGVFWLRADRETSLVEDLASLAWRLSLDERAEPEQERQVEAVVRWLREHSRWLLVLDNLEPATPAQQWLPPGLPGRMLVTSRTPQGPARLHLGPLPFQTARRFLLERTGQGDIEAAGTIAEALGCLPLALEQAAAFLEVSGRDLGSYAELLRTRLLDLMAEGTPDDYPRPLATTWRLSIMEVERERPTAAALLRLCAFLAPDDIPIGLLQAGDAAVLGGLGEALGDAIEFDRAVAVLRRYSLLERQGDGLRVHRLVQAVVRESLRVDRAECLAAAIRLLRAEFPDLADRHPDRWATCARLLPHVLGAVHLAGAAEAEPAALSALLHRVGRYLRARGQLGMARSAFERALGLRERMVGPDHRDTAESLNELAILLTEQGEPAGARPLFERALAIRQRVLGPHDPATAESLNDLATLLATYYDPAIALPLQRRAVAIVERSLGPDHPHTAYSLGNLGAVLRQMGELGAARPPLERALAIREKVLGCDHPETAHSLHHLGWLLLEQGELAAAERLLGRAVAVREGTLGPDHPHTARSLHLLALVRQSSGDLPAARALAERSLAILERAVGPEHRWTIDSRLALEGMRPR